MTDGSWLLYGATGHTGRLTALQASASEHQPVLAGRSAAPLRSLAEELNLEYIVCDLEDDERLRNAVADFDLVCHLAGPFSITHEPMLRACLEGETNYLDISGELPTIRAVRSIDQEARRQNIAVIPAAGFVVVPTDCSALHAANMVSDPYRLETAVAAEAGASAGTIKTMLRTLPDGFVVREDNLLIQQPVGAKTRRVTFTDRDRPVVAAPQADLLTGYMTTGIPNITSYIGVPERADTLIRRIGPSVRSLVSIPQVRSFATRMTDRYVSGPGPELRETTRACTWVRVIGRTGAEAEVWLETTETYQFTAHAVVRAAERILAERPQGVLTPARALGADFPLEIPGTQRFVQVNP